MVREFEKTPTDNLVIVVDPWVAAGRDRLSEPEEGLDQQAQVLERQDHNLEQLLSIAGSVCWEWCRQKGDQLVLAVAGSSPEIVTGITGQKLAIGALQLLARAQGTPAPDEAALIHRLSQMHLPAASVLFLSTRDRSFDAALSLNLNRPVAFVNISEPTDFDFYEKRPATFA